MVTREHQPHLGRHVLHGRHGRPLALLWGEDEVAGTVEVEGGERPAGGVHSTHHQDWGHLVLGSSFRCSCLPPYLGLDQLVPSQLTHAVWRGEEEAGEVDQEAEWDHHHRTVLSSRDLRNSKQGVLTLPLLTGEFFSERQQPPQLDHNAWQETGSCPPAGPHRCLQIHHSQSSLRLLGLLYNTIDFGPKVSLESPQRDIVSPKEMVDHRDGSNGFWITDIVDWKGNSDQYIFFIHCGSGAKLCLMYIIMSID